MSASQRGATSTPPHLDAQLLRLGAAFKDAWARENEAWAVVEEDESIQEGDPRILCARRLADATGAMAVKIENRRARTLDGLLVKIRALDWCRYGDPVTVNDFIPCGHIPDPEVKVVVSLINDLWLMGSA